jgi:hypothetical protein
LFLIQIRTGISDNFTLMNMYKKIEQYGDRIFIISLLTMVMVVALSFKKPAGNKIQEDRSYSSVEDKPAQTGFTKQSNL